MSAEAVTITCGVSIMIVLRPTMKCKALTINEHVSA